MTRLFGRKVTVECGNRTAINMKPVIFDDQFHIEFEYRRNDSTTMADTASVTIWNAGQYLGDLFQNLSKDTYLKIRGGYEGREGTLFAGDVTMIDPIAEGVDSGWRVIVGDGAVALNVPVIKSYRPKMNTKKIVDDIFAAMKEGGAELAAGMKKVLDTAVAGKTEGGMTAIRDSAGAALEKILAPMNVEPRIVNDEVYFVDKQTGELRDYSMNLSPQTGLVGSVKRSTRTEKDNKVTEGVTFTCLILPDIFPGRRVNIESRLVTGSFVVREASARGSNYGGDWTMECFAS
jgi:hypothetical protein